MLVIAHLCAVLVASCALRQGFDMAANFHLKCDARFR